MIYGIYTNIKRDKDCEATQRFIKILKKSSIDYLICDICLIEGENTYPIDYILERCDFMVCFGGDGTMLECVSHCAGRDISVLGINLGNLGFLTEIGESDAEIEKAIDLIKKNQYFTEQRSMLEVEHDSHKYFGLNEIILGSGISSKICDFSLYIDDILADNLRADGIIVSTPTGSTAYNLSCGGAILSPDVQAFIVNAICPHSLHSSPMVISDNSVVRVEGRGDLKLLLDGKIICDNLNNSCITVKKSVVKAKFIRFEKANFFNLLLNKMSRWR